MSKEMRNIGIGFTVHSSEHLPEKDGEQMYADDVATEMIDVINAALDTWYAQRGKDLLACEPIVH